MTIGPQSGTAALATKVLALSSLTDGPAATAALNPKQVELLVRAAPKLAEAVLKMASWELDPLDQETDTLKNAKIVAVHHSTSKWEPGGLHFQRELATEPAFLSRIRGFYGIGGMGAKDEAAAYRKRLQDWLDQYVNSKLEKGQGRYHARITLNGLFSPLRKK